MNTILKDDIALVLSGEAGQGLQTIERILSSLLNSRGYRTFTFSEYMSRVRGGCNSTLIRVSNKQRSAYVERADIFIALSKLSIPRYRDRISQHTLVVGDLSILGESAEGVNVQNIPVSKLAQEAGGRIYQNTVVAGVFLSFFDIEEDAVESFIKYTFLKKGEKVVEENINAMRLGRNAGEELQRQHDVVLEVTTYPEKYYDLFMSGSDAVCLGALSGGCNYISSYPMTPGTSVFEGLARYSKDFDIVVEQAEDEISAINMGLGAWYSGARAMVSTSGGGFALMVEGLSLAGMIESPMVIHLAQRPGPATGFPTRTEQGDLNFALGAGHGEFARVILAPGTIEEGYNLTAEAFDIADVFQIPVIILTDQFFVDSYASARSENMPIEEVTPKIIQTCSTYQRYAYTENGISPRGIPGFGDGVVCIDSDEHDTEGRITESHETREMMMDKRMSRLAMLEESAIEPVFTGAENGKILVIGWGSTFGVISEAVDEMSAHGLKHMHVRQVYPLGNDVVAEVMNAERVIVVENNYSGQFATLLRQETGRDPDEVVVQYNGLPFSVERLTRVLHESLKELESYSHDDEELIRNIETQ